MKEKAPRRGRNRSGDGSKAEQTQHQASRVRRKGRKDIKARVDFFQGRQQLSYNTADITMLKFKCFVVALFAAIVHASSIGQFSRPLSFTATTANPWHRRPFQGLRALLSSQSSM